MHRLVVASVLLLGMSPAPQEGASVQSLLDAMSALGRIRWKQGAAEVPCVYLVTPSGHAIVAAHVTRSDEIKPDFAPFEAVFEPDSPQPKTAPAVLVAQDEGVAWFKLEGALSIKPLEIRPVSSQRRGGTIFAAGVRSITSKSSLNQLSLAVLQTIRYDDRQECMYLKSAHLIRDFQPLALLDPAGRLVALEGRRSWPRTPLEMLDSIEGTVVSTETGGLREEASRLKGTLTLRISNPLGRLKSITALFLQKQLIKEWPKTPDSNGRWPEVGPQATEVRIIIDGNRGTADLNVTLDATQERYWAFQYRVVRGDGAIRHSSWSFIDLEKLGEEPRFSRYFEERPQTRPPRGPEGPPKLAAVPTGAPVVTGVSLLENIEVTRGAQISRSHPIPGIRAACWSSDHRHVYVLDRMNVVRKISFPEFREVCEYGIGFECTDLRRSAEGLVVMVAGLKEVWVLSTGSLSLRTRLPLGTDAKLAVGENSSTAWALLHGMEFLALDLSAGRIAKRITMDSLEPGAAKAVRPAVVEKLRVSEYAVSPNGRHLVAAGDKQIHRFSVNGSNLAYEEISPPLESRVQRLLFSPDSFYFCVVSNGRSSVFRTASLDAPVVEYSRVNVEAFDKAAEVLYGTNLAAPGIHILRTDGTIERTIGSRLRAQQVLVHPEGSKLLLMSNDMTLVELLE